MTSGPRGRGWLLTLALAGGAIGCGDRPNSDPTELSSGPAGPTTFTVDRIDVDRAVLAGEICDRLIACQWTAPGDRTECIERVEDFMILVIDGPAFISCIRRHSCAELGGWGISEAMTTCFDLDEESLSCQGDALRYCDHARRCTQVACEEICTVFAQYLGDPAFACCDCRPQYTY